MPMHWLRSSVGALAALAMALALAGCSATLFPRAEVGDTAPVPPPERPVAAEAAPTGAIYQRASYRPLFEDHRARHIGDLLTVRIEERVTATQSATSTIDKTGSVAASVSALPGISPKAFARGTAAGDSSNTFEGKGSTEASNLFSGTVTATVARVLPNGHLIVAGEKQIGVNHNVDVLRFSGQVDPRSIQAGNVVSSTAIANVRIEHRARGAQHEAQMIGWLARVFLSVLPI